MSTIFKPPPPSGGNPNKGLQTRRRSLVAAALAATIATAVLLIFLAQYRDSVAGNDETESVLVAKSLIARGSSGDVIARDGLFQVVNIERGDVKDGALTDPDALRGKVANVDVYAGQQLTVKEFGVGGNRVNNQLSGSERAIAIPVDAAHGLIGEVQPGDHVDVYGAFNVEPVDTGKAHAVLKTLMQNVLVLRAPSKPDGGIGGGDQSVILRVPDEQAGEFAFAAENGKVWLTLRPQAGAKQAPPSLNTIETVLFGLDPVRAQRLVRSGR